MNLLTFSRIVFRKLPWLIFFPGLLAGLVYYLTRDMSREYQSTTLIYTGLASGYSLGAEDATPRIDYFGVNNAFDNLITTIKSRETIEEVALKLLAQHLMLNEPDNAVANAKTLETLNEMVPTNLRAQLVVPGNFDSTYHRLRAYASGSQSNVVLKILNGTKSNYSITNIMAGLTVARKAASDMLEVTYKADDAGVCLHTLIFLTDVFKRRYVQVKGSETGNVVKYFEEQLRKAFILLQKAEDNLKDFGIENRIINYQEQSKFIAESKEDMTAMYYQEVMRFGAAKAAVERLETKMDQRGVVVGNNKDMLELKAELGEAYRKLANAKVYGSSDEEIENLQADVDQKSEEFRQLAKQYYSLNNTVESVPQPNLVSQWLQKVLDYEESAARLTVYEKRLKEFDEIYDQFAPLGSTISRLVREVDVAEKEYLSVLHGLNLAKLRQQNIRMANTLTITDQPFLPLTPLPSKRKLLIIAAFMGGVVILLGIFVGRELLDNSVKSPEKAAKISGFALAGAMPLKDKTTRHIDFDKLERSLLEQLVSSFTIELRSSKKTTPYHLVIIFSAIQGEGKTWIAERLVRKFATINGKVLYLYPDFSERFMELSNEKIGTWGYHVGADFVDTPNIQTLLEGSGQTTSAYSYIFLELPYLADHPIPAELVSQAHLSLLVMNAEVAWPSASDNMTKMYQRAATNNIMVMLNRVAPDMLESLYGEVPKKRSLVRRFAKKIVSIGVN